MKRFVWSLLLFLILAGVVSAAPGAPWLYDLWDDETITPTTGARTFTLETVDQAYILYNLGKTSTVTVTGYITVTEGWDGVVFNTQTANGSITPITATTGIITLTTTYPNVSVQVNVGTDSVISSVGVWQK